MMQAAQDAAACLHAQTGSGDHLIGTVLADAGYASDANLAAAGPDRLIALAKGRDQSKAAPGEPAETPPLPGATIRQLMAHRLRTEEGRTLYNRRGATVFGQTTVWTAGSCTSGDPLVPAGWSTWILWQYSCMGTVSGIYGNVDLDQPNPAVITLLNVGSRATMAGATIMRSHVTP